jgi:hypothetical protein
MPGSSHLIELKYKKQWRDQQQQPTSASVESGLSRTPRALEPVANFIIRPQQAGTTAN